MRKNTELALTWLFCLIFGLIVFTYYHEHIHYEIFRQFGISSRIEYGFPYSYTVPYKNQSYDSAETARIASTLQAENELTGYSIEAIFFMFMIALYIFGDFILGELDDKHGKERIP